LICSFSLVYFDSWTVSVEVCVVACGQSSEVDRNLVSCSNVVCSS
jgi:hypothetical protein